MRHSAVCGVNNGTCHAKKDLAILSLILTSDRDIMMFALCASRELNLVSDYLFYLSVLTIRSDAAGSFDADSSSAPASTSSTITSSMRLPALPVSIQVVWAAKNTSMRVIFFAAAGGAADLFVAHKPPLL